MKVNDQTNYSKEFDNEGSSDEVSTFNVASDPLIMQRLSDKVYNDPISAILRELGTNAYDAQIDTGKQKTPFQVHLPTLSEDTFWIRDFGPGISKEDLLTKYVTYAVSTRRNSNEHIGSIGIGSKSPYAYGQQFIVESFYGGEHITALCYKDKSSMPMIRILDQKPSTEPTGLKVSFAVKPDDFWQFQNKAAKVYQWFETKPETNLEVDYSDGYAENHVFSGDNWYIIDDYQTYVVMGNVCYKAPNQGWPCVLFANVGDVEINISRETLQDNQHNRDWIKAAVEKLEKELREDLQKKIDQEPSKFDATCLLYSLSQLVPNRLEIGEITYQGEEIKYNVKLPSDTQYGSIHAYGNPYWKRNVCITDLDPKDTDVFFADIKSGAIKATKEYRQKKAAASENNYYSRDTILVKGDKDSFLQTTGYPEDKLIMASKYYTKPPSTRSKTTSSNAHHSVFEFCPSCNGINTNKHSMYWKAINTGTYTAADMANMSYTVIKRYQPTEVSPTTGAQITNQVISEMISGQANTKKIIGIKPKEEKWAKKLGMTPIGTYITGLPVPQTQIDFCKQHTFTLKVKEHCGDLTDLIDILSKSTNGASFLWKDPADEQTFLKLYNEKTVDTYSYYRYRSTPNTDRYKKWLPRLSQAEVTNINNLADTFCNDYKDIAQEDKRFAWMLEMRYSITRNSGIIDYLLQGPKP